MEQIDWEYTIYEPKQLKKAFQDSLLDGRPHQRIVMAGRSNVGKSSLINHLMKRKKARVSKTPGKTAAIHCYQWGKKILVDLPGYGFAKKSNAERKRWESLIEAYFKIDIEIEVVLVLVDSKVGVTPNDQALIEFLLFFKIPIKIVLTKMDQLKRQSDRQKAKASLTQAFQKYSISMDDVFWVSNFNKDGIKNLEMSLQ